MVEVVPPPSLAQHIRIPKMLHPDLHYDVTTDVKPNNKLEKDLYSCDDGPDAYIVTYVSKMFAVRPSELPERKRKVMTAEEMRAKGREAREARAALGTESVSAPIPLELSAARQTESSTTKAEDQEEEEEEEVLLGFARLYSGTITRSTKLYCVLPKYNATLPPSHPSNVKHITVVEITGLYVMMGRELVPVDKVTAGNVFAIAGLAGIVWRNATLCAIKSEQDLQLDAADANKACLVNLAGINNQVGVPC